MENETIFYIFGGTLAALAVIVSFLGIRSEGFPGSRALFSGITLAFVVLVAGTATFGVASARDEQAAREAEEAEHAEEGHAEPGAEGEAATPGAEGGGTGAQPPNEPAGEDTATPEAGDGDKQGGGQPGGGQGAATGGPGGTLELAADPVQLLFDKTELTSKPGEVTIDFTNPSAVPHDVAILDGEEELAKSDLIAESETSVSAELAPGSYQFICTVPGHAEAGMQGVLTVR